MPGPEEFDFMRTPHRQSRRSVRVWMLSGSYDTKNSAETKMQGRIERCADRDARPRKRARISPRAKGEAKVSLLESLPFCLFELMLDFLRAPDQYAVSKASRELASRPLFNVLQRRVDALSRKEGYISPEDFEDLVDGLTDKQLWRTFELRLVVPPWFLSSVFFQSPKRGDLRWVNLQVLSVATAAVSAIGRIGEGVTHYNRTTDAFPALKKLTLRDFMFCYSKIALIPSLVSLELTQKLCFEYQLSFRALLKASRVLRTLKITPSPDSSVCVLQVPERELRRLCVFDAEINGHLSLSLCWFGDCDRIKLKAQSLMINEDFSSHRVTINHLDIETSSLSVNGLFRSSHINRVCIRYPSLASVNKGVIQLTENFHIKQVRLRRIERDEARELGDLQSHLASSGESIDFQAETMGRKYL